MKYSSSTLFSGNNDSELASFANHHRGELEIKAWTEDQLDLTHSVSDYANSSADVRSILGKVFELFFILETEVINLAKNVIIEHSNTLSCIDYQRYVLVYILNEMTHSRFYRDLYCKVVMYDQTIDDDHLESLYARYNSIDVFRNRVTDIIDVSADELTWRDFIRFACIEGIKFMSLFFFIFYYSRGSKFNAVEEGNRWVADDEYVHSDVWINMAKYLFDKERRSSNKREVDYTELIDFARETISSYESDESEFCEYMFSEFGDLNDLRTYIQWLADRVLNTLLKLCSMNEERRVSIPSFMQRLTFSSKESLHETINTNYRKGLKINLGIDDI